MFKEDLQYISKTLYQVAEDLDQKRILITGGTGFFGINLLNTFKYMIEEEKYHFTVDVIARNPERLKKSNKELYHFKNFNFISHDIINPLEIDCNYDFIIHAATSASKEINDNHPDIMVKTIINGTINILDFCKNYKTKLLYISSGAVYGNNASLYQNLAINHYNAIDPLSINYSYHLSKICAENLCFSYSKNFGLEIKIARCFAFVGPYLPLDSHFAIGNFINSVINNEKIIINTKGGSTRSFLYSSDLIIWLLKILFFGKNLKPYNVGSPEKITIAELASKVANFASIPIEIKGLPEKESFYVPNVDETMNELNIDNFINLDKAIQKTIEWYESQ